MAAHLRKNYGNGVSGKRTMLRDTRIGHLLFPVSSMVLTRTQLSKTKISINPEQRNHQELSESNDEYSVYRFSLSIQIQLTPSILIHPRLPRQASIRITCPTRSLLHAIIMSSDAPIRYTTPFHPCARISPPFIPSYFHLLRRWQKASIEHRLYQSIHHHITNRNPRPIIHESLPQGFLYPFAVAFYSSIHLGSISLGAWVQGCF